MKGHHRRSYNAHTKIATPSFEIKPSMDLCNLYIKGIQPGMSSTDLFNLFKPFGRIISAKVMQQDKGKKGFGFVSYSKSVEAAHAILSMNVDDMVVKFHEPKVPRKEHDFDQQLAYLSDSELAMHFYTRPLDSKNKMMPLVATNKSAYMPTTTTGIAAAATAAAVPYYYYHPPSLYYHHPHPPPPHMYTSQLPPQPLTQDQYTKMKLLDMLKYVNMDLSNQERDIVQQQLAQLDLSEQYACINDIQYFQEKITNMLTVYSDSHGEK